MHGLVVVGGEQVLEGVEVRVGEEFGERGVGSRFDEEGTFVVAVNGGRVLEAPGERVERGQHLGERVLKEFGFGREFGDIGVGVVRVEEGHVAVDVGGKLVYKRQFEDFKVWRCG